MLFRDGGFGARAFGLGAALLATFASGLFVGTSWPHTPLHATATDSGPNLVTATGRLDDQVEGLFALDFTTGNLRGAAINPRSGRFTAQFQRNVLADLGLADVRHPQFLMVTGHLDFQSSAVQRAQMVLYVTETTTGQTAAYAIPWNPSTARLPTAITGQFVLLDRMRVREGSLAK
ncbi:MAG: hypothetical protein U0836_03745 [Pirellulales bacterium]